MYLQTYQFPEFGKSIDKFDTVVTALIELIEKYRDYTQLHTKILIAALLWQERQKQTEYLLVGKEREVAEKWLLQEFVAPEQAPCLPSTLMAEFICESKKNAENLMTEVFMSYSSKDKALQNKIYVSLSKKLVTTWYYTQDISKTEDAEQATWRGLEQADNFVFLVSNYSLQSEFCLKELNYAFDLQKKIIPLLVEKLNADNIAKLKTLTKLNSLQFVDFTNNTEEAHYQSDINEILKELNKEKRYHEQHKVFLVQGLKWEKQQRNASILLRGSNLENAKTWLNTAKTRTDYKPTKLHEEFIGESLAKIGQLGSEVFISYSRNDADFARKLNNELQLYGKTTWFDQESISSGADFQQEIYKGIAESDNFVFLISPKSVNSPYCEDEVNFAATQGKRFITLLVESLDTESHEKFNSLKALSQVQWIDCTQKDFYSVFMQLIRQIDTDRDYVEQHTKWQKKATEAKTTPPPAPPLLGGVQMTSSMSKTPLPIGEGQGVGFKSELLLRGSELILAQAWLADAEKNKKNPKATDIQKALIEASDNARKQEEDELKATNRKLKNRFRIAVAAAIVAGVLFLLSLVAGAYIAVLSIENERILQKANVTLKKYYETQIADSENIRNILRVDKNEKGVQIETAKIDSIKNLIKGLQVK